MVVVPSVAASTVVSWLALADTSAEVERLHATVVNSISSSEMLNLEIIVMDK